MLINHLYTKAMAHQRLFILESVLQKCMTKTGYNTVWNRRQQIKQSTTLMWIKYIEYLLPWIVEQINAP